MLRVVIAKLVRNVHGNTLVHNIHVCARTAYINRIVHNYYSGISVHPIRNASAHTRKRANASPPAPRASILRPAAHCIISHKAATAPPERKSSHKRRRRQLLLLLRLLRLLLLLHDDSLRAYVWWKYKILCHRRAHLFLVPAFFFFFLCLLLFAPNNKNQIVHLNAQTTHKSFRHDFLSISVFGVAAAFVCSALFEASEVFTHSSWCTQHTVPPKKCTVNGRCPLPMFLQKHTHKKRPSPATDQTKAKAFLNTHKKRENIKTRLYERWR